MRRGSVIISYLEDLNDPSLLIFERKRLFTVRAGANERTKLTATLFCENNLIIRNINDVNKQVIWIPDPDVDTTIHDIHEVVQSHMNLHNKIGSSRTCIETNRM